MRHNTEMLKKGIRQYCCCCYLCCHRHRVARAAVRVPRAKIQKSAVKGRAIEGFRCRTGCLTSFWAQAGATTVATQSAKNVWHQYNKYGRAQACRETHNLHLYLAATAVASDVLRRVALATTAVAVVVEYRSRGGHPGLPSSDAISASLLLCRNGTLYF